MKNIKIIGIVVLITLYNMTNAQDFAGNFQLQTENGIISLILEKDNSGSYIGNLRGNGEVFLLQGTVQNGYLVGYVGEQNSGIVFQAERQNNYLTLSLVETYSDGTPNLNTAQNMIFEQTSGTAIQQEINVNDEKIVINNVTLNQKQIEEMEKTYGAKPMPGNYWYDKRSGLYGVVGYPAYGFMYSGHDFGVIDRYASGGNTGVITNGRELTQSEWAVCSYMLNYYIQPGMYWMDDQGNIGVEGVNVPIVNLFVAAQQNNYSGKGGSGDNFWSTRFSAGNSDSGNTRGYVSVPGYGPVGYGF